MLRLGECFTHRWLGLGKLGFKFLSCIDSTTLFQPGDHRFRVFPQDEPVPEFEFRPPRNKLMDDPIKRTTEHLTGSRINFADQDVPMCTMSICCGALFFMFYNNRSRCIEIEFLGDHCHHLLHLLPGGRFMGSHDKMSDGICRTLRRRIKVHVGDICCGAADKFDNIVVIAIF